MVSATCRRDIESSVYLIEPPYYLSNILTDNTIIVSVFSHSFITCRKLVGELCVVNTTLLTYSHITLLAYRLYCLTAINRDTLDL